MEAFCQEFLCLKLHSVLTALTFTAQVHTFIFKSRVLLLLAMLSRLVIVMVTSTLWWCEAMLLPRLSAVRRRAPCTGTLPLANSPHPHYSSPPPQLGTSWHWGRSCGWFHFKLYLIRPLARYRALVATQPWQWQVVVSGGAGAGRRNY